MVQGREAISVTLRSVVLWTRRRLALWIVLGAATNVALLGLVGLVIQVPGQATTTVTWLILVFLVLSALTIVFPLAGHLVEQRDQRTTQQRHAAEREADREREWRDRVNRLLTEGSCDQLRPLSELSDDTLGATATLYTREGNAPYVRRRTRQRDHDAELRALLGEPGPPYPFVVVWGTTKAGKSRTLAEAARAVFTNDPAVIIPQRGGQALAELARLGLPIPADGGPALVWLDDLNPADLEALTSPVLDAVTRRAAICATMTAKRREEVIKTGGEVTAVAQAALNRALEFELSFHMSEEEKTEAQQLYPKEQFDASIAETLVGGRELIAKYQAGPDSNPAGCAIVRAAIDCRRAGLSRPVAEPELRHLFPMYLHTVRRGVPPTTEQFADGLTWATAPIASQVALLHLADPVHQPSHWTVFDHVVTVDDGTREHQSRPIPEELWHELITILSPSDLFGIGMAAHTRQEGGHAIEAFRKASYPDRPEIELLARVLLGLLLAERGDTDGARAAYQQAIDSGQPNQASRAAVHLGRLLAEQGDTDAARAAYQQAIDAGHPDYAPMAAVHLGRLLAGRGDTDAARAAYQLAIDSGHPKASEQAQRFLDELD
jgi:hypothetical protein